MRILITGGSGLLGSKIASIALEKDDEIYSGYYNHRAIIGNTIRVDVSDKTQVEQVYDRIKPEIVVHTAALTHVDKCEEDRELARKINVEGTKNIVESSERHNAFLIYVSTDYVFSGEEGMYNEYDDPCPINYYGSTKLEAEKIVAGSTLEWCIARSSVIYGSTPAAGKINFALWILEKLIKKEPIKIITCQWVSPTLNTNLAEMILEIIERRLIGIYHLAGATPLNRFDFAMNVATTFTLDKTLISPAKLSEMNWLANRPRNSTLNVGKASKTLRSKPHKIQYALSRLKEEIENI